VHINTPLEISSQLCEGRGRRLEIHGDLRDGGELLADADGSFVHVPLEHFLRTPEGRAARDFWAERLR